MMLCFLFFTVLPVMVISCNAVKFLELGILVLLSFTYAARGCQEEDCRKRAEDVTTF